MRIAAARIVGLSDEWIKKIENAPGSKYQIMYILNILNSNSPAARLLNIGDIVLSIDGKVITRMDDLSEICTKPSIEMVCSW